MTVIGALIAVVIAAAGAAAASAMAASRSGRGDRALGDMVAALATSATEQADSMRRLADLSAESMRAATGTYVFQLRDRFDDALPPVQVGMSASSWSAVGDAPGPVEMLVLHSGDQVRFTATLVVNQAPLRREVRVTARGTASPLPDAGHDCGSDGLSLQPVGFTASASRSTTGSAFDLPSDVSLFVAVPVDLAIGSVPFGPFRRAVSVDLACTDTRPEGVISTTIVELTISGVAVPDDDGIGLDLLAIEADISGEARAYYLDKASLLALGLPSAIHA